MKDRLAERDRLLSQSAGNQPAPMARTPYFCSGCPHNTSTRVPEGSRAGAGIGCHYMAQWMDRNTAAFTHMGAEGANWTGQAHRSEEHTSELQSLMRISYAVFCLKKKITYNNTLQHINHLKITPTQRKQ